MGKYIFLKYSKLGKESLINNKNLCIDNTSTVFTASDHFIFSNYLVGSTGKEIYNVIKDCEKRYFLSKDKEFLKEKCKIYYKWYIFPYK